jgi:hypothetical protein
MGDRLARMPDRVSHEGTAMIILAVLGSALVGGVIGFAICARLIRADVLIYRKIGDDEDWRP